MTTIFENLKAQAQNPERDVEHIWDVALKAAQVGSITESQKNEIYRLLTNDIVG